MGRRQHPDRLQLYSLTTPNGVKVSILLEETGLPYEAHRVSFDTRTSTRPSFNRCNPYGKIPAILRPPRAIGQPLALFESGAILLYLAEKTGKLLPADPAARYEAIQWLMFQMGGVGPMFGQVGFFHKFAGREYDDKRPRDRYVAPVQAAPAGTGRAAGGPRVADGRRRTPIADIATFPWVRNLSRFLRRGRPGGDRRGSRNVTRVLESFLARPAVQRGLGTVREAARPQARRALVRAGLPGASIGRRISAFTSLSTTLERTCVTPGSLNTVSCRKRS